MNDGFSTRYAEPRAQSAELLRLALAQMGQNDAAFTPLSFTVWYEHLAGINPRLSQDLQHRQLQTPRLGDQAIAELYQQHIAPLDETTGARISGQFQQLMQRMSDSAGQTGNTAGQVGAQLDGLTLALRVNDPGALAGQLNQAMAGISQMQQAVAALQAEVATSRNEIEQLRHDLSRARQDATLCPLTGILNRKGFDEQLASLLAARVGQARPLCLVMVDIDHFKRVNDAHGHLMGDRVIQALGEILRSSIAALPGASSARYGGEEFAILLQDSSVAQARQLADTVRSRTQAMKLRNRSTQEVLLTVTVSAGVAAWLPDDDAAGLISRADAALYRSKQAGRNQVTTA